MSEINLKAHYQGIEAVEVNLADQVMAEISGQKSRKGRLSTKMIAVAAAVMIFIMGCGYLATQTFYGPDGEILWQLNAVERDMDMSWTEVYDYKDLQTGEILYLGIENSDGGVEMSIIQKPWIIESLDIISEKNVDTYGFNLESAYGSFAFQNTEVRSMYDEEDDQWLVDSIAEDLETQDNAYRIIQGDYDLSTSLTHTYVSGDNLLVISLMPWLGSDVNYDEDEGMSYEPLTIYGYEGALNSDEHQMNYEIVVGEQRLTIDLLGDVQDQALIETIAGDFLAGK